MYIYIYIYIHQDFPRLKKPQKNTGNKRKKVACRQESGGCVLL